MLSDTARWLLDARADAWPVSIVRVCIGLAALARAWATCHVLNRVLTQDRVRMPYGPGVPDLPSALIPLLVGVWALAAIAFMLGWRTRLAGGILTIIMAYTLLLDQQTYSNHLYLLALLVLLLTVAESDARLSLRSWSASERITVPAWPILLLKFQVTIVYFFAAIAKINEPYLSGALLAVNLRSTGWLALPTAWQTPTILATLAALSILVELFLAFALWIPRLRGMAVVAGLTLHGLMVGLLLPEVAIPIAIFAIEMCALYLLFFDLSPMARWWARVPAVTLSRLLPSSRTAS